MSWTYVVAFWVVSIGAPALWAGCLYRSWFRAAVVAAMVVVVPFGLTLALTFYGGPGDWTDAAAVGSWVSQCADSGAPAGYALGILLSVAAFRWRDRTRPERGEVRSLLLASRRQTGRVPV